MHEVLVNRLGGLNLPRECVVWLTDCPYMTLDVYRGRKTTIQQQQQIFTYDILFVLGPNLSAQGYNTTLKSLGQSFSRGNTGPIPRGAVVEWLEQLGYGAESRRIA